MQSDKFDKKVIEAAERHHPPYDEKAWDRMEKLLDKHLPEKDDRRRRIFFFMLMALLLGAATWVITARPWQQHRAVADNTKQPVTATATNSNTNSNTSVTPSSTGKESSGNPSSSATNGTPDQVTAPSGTAPTATTDQNSIHLTDNNISTRQQTGPATPGSGTAGNSPSTSTIGKPPLNTVLPGDYTASVTAGAKGKRRKAGEVPATQKESNTDDPSTKPIYGRTTPGSGNQPLPVQAEDAGKKGQAGKANPDQQPKNEVAAETTVKKDQPGEAQKANAVPASTAATDGKDQPEPKAEVAKKETPKQKSPARKRNSLFLALSAGPDVSFVGDNKMGKMKLLSGAGLAYSIKDRFTIRTGFYTARKVYTAKPQDYKAPPQFYQYYPYLEKVDANCKVYEIPIALSYNFGKKGNHHFFVSAAVSTLLMKEEKYNYFYKYSPTGMTYQNDWTIRNKNKHYFSIGTLSGGYQQAIGKKFTFLAEPYLKVPFSGVGYGKVKLNSGGVMFTVGMKLF